MIDIMYISSAPIEEDCVQVGDKDYHILARDECNRFIELIRKKFGPEPDGAKLVVTSNPHDFGTYHEVVVKFDDAKEDACKYAYAVEANTPLTWNDTEPVDWREE